MHNVAQLRRLREQFSGELVIIGVHSAKFPAEGATTNIREAAMRRGVDHPVVNDVDFKIWQSYAVKAWPTLVLINPAGKIVDTQSGEILADDYARKIAALIAEAEAEGTLDRRPLDLQPERMTEPRRPLKYPAKLLAVRQQRSSEHHLYIADTGHHRLLEVKLTGKDQSGRIVRIFGTGQPGLKDGPANEAMFHDPHGMALSGLTLYVADTANHAVRAIDLQANTVRTVAGTGHKGHGRFEVGQPTQTALRSPWALWAEKNILLIAMAGSHQIWALVGEERLGIFAGNGREALVDGPLVEASFNQPSDLDAGFGHMFIADSEASAIRAISMGEDPQVMTVIGQGLFEFGDVDGQGGMVRLQHPTGLGYYDGLVYIADSYNHKIKTLDPTTGEVKTLVGTGQAGHNDGPFEKAELFEPEGLAALEGRLYIADTNNHLIRVANLGDRTVHTLMLHGLEQLGLTFVPEELQEVMRLDPVRVGPGEVEVRLNIKLPPGYKLTADAAQLLKTSLNGQGMTHAFEATEMPKFPVNLESDGDLDLNLTLYYCQTSDRRLCMIHDARLILPLTVSEAGEQKVTITYDMPRPSV